VPQHSQAAAAAIAGYLHRSLGKRRAVVLETPTMYGRSMAAEFECAFRQRGGQVLLRCAVGEGQRDFGSLVRALPKAFDLLFYGGSFEGAFILRALRAAGLSQLFAAGDGCWDRTGFLEPAGEAAMAGEGVLVLSATPEVGRVPGSGEFAARYAARHGPIGNYAVNAYDSTRLLLAAMAAAQAGQGGADRRGILSALRSIQFQGIAYPRPVAWDEKGENRAAVTALFVGEKSRFRQVAEIAKEPAPKEPAR
jgi:branched-chain amino acid transport system substrate-binding protein